MSGVLVIGLPKSLEKRFAVECGRKGLKKQIVLADIGKMGRGFVLIPYPGQAIAAVRSYADNLATYADAYVVVLPYTAIPDGLDDELDTLKEYGATVIRAENGQDGWPHIADKKKPDTDILNAMYARLWHAMPALADVAEVEEDLLPSEYFRQVLDANPRVLVADRVLDVCDLVTPLRRKFLHRAIEALTEFAAEGSSGRIDAFFGERQLHHAQSGGISTTLSVYCGEELVYEATSHAHLKQGDATTLQGAARLYYHQFTFNGLTYVVITYAGPHPDSNVKCICSIPGLVRKTGSG